MLRKTMMLLSLLALAVACKSASPTTNASTPSTFVYAMERAIPVAADLDRGLLREVTRAVRGQYATRIATNAAAEPRVLLQSGIYAQIVGMGKPIPRPQLRQMLHDVVTGSPDACGGASCSRILGVEPEQFLDTSYQELKFRADLAADANQPARSLLIASFRPDASELGAHYGISQWGSADVKLNFVSFEGQVPKGFATPGEFQGFSADLHKGLAARYPGTEAFVAGSAVTGRKFTTGAPFDEGRLSDFDIALSGESIFEAAKARKIQLRGGGRRTAPLGPRDVSGLGLWDLQQSLAKKAQREVHFMIYQSADDIVGRAPSIVFPH